MIVEWSIAPLPAKRGAAQARGERTQRAAAVRATVALRGENPDTARERLRTAWADGGDAMDIEGMHAALAEWAVLVPDSYWARHRGSSGATRARFERVASAQLRGACPAVE